MVADCLRGSLMCVCWFGLLRCCFSLSFFSDSVYDHLWTASRRSGTTVTITFANSPMTSLTNFQACL